MCFIYKHLLFPLRSHLSQTETDWEPPGETLDCPGGGGPTPLHTLGEIRAAGECVVRRVSIYCGQQQGAGESHSIGANSPG